MRKLHKVALVVAAAGGLTGVGAGPSSAVTPYAQNGTVPPPVSQPDAQAASAASAQATAQTNGSSAPQAAPQRGTQVSPQINPQLNPQINPQISSAAPQAGQGTSAGQANLFRPAQECSPQTLLDANVPVALLAASQTRGVDCTQANSQSNSFASVQ
ncbi:hypothetical protein SAMN05216532_0236 [Streptomyces sp. 2231.1]|uniref:hypothetical protein n=1 Tax=Streptomyces sp. 2231.1 TaxID=1855347 RepID=UPI000897231F|nr:hypothetical protein [Streptomyces sp. 2231.1]SEC02660.1 hypothetical protein SAMN05216532_0236 [Streptomyces sp. 2231.1]